MDDGDSGRRDVPYAFSRDLSRSQQDRRSDSPAPEPDTAWRGRSRRRVKRANVVRRTACRCAPARTLRPLVVLQVVA